MTAMNPNPDRNAALADALITAAGLLRLNPELPEVYGIEVHPDDRTHLAWNVELNPSVSGESDRIDAVRTFAAVLGPEADTYLSELHEGHCGDPFRQLSATACRGVHHISMWALIDDTPTVSES
jgi:hypothetical protein